MTRQVSLALEQIPTNTYLKSWRNSNMYGNFNFPKTHHDFKKEKEKYIYS